MKTDAPLPAAVPKKRRAMEQLLDLHIAVWLGGDDISPGERRRLEAERRRRKALAPVPRAVGIVVDEAGTTPQQLERLSELLDGATSVHHCGVPRKVHSRCRREGLAVVVHADVRDMLRNVALVLAFPREPTVQTYSKPGVWTTIGLARHRSLVVEVVLPNGQAQEGQR